MEKLKLSIAIATYNSAITLRESIDSVLMQNYTNLELIIVDGGSKDGTLSIIKDYSIKNPQIKWISEPDRGVYDAMNKALKIATGDYLLFLGSDDHLISNEVLSGVIAKMDDYNSVYYGDVYRNARNDLYKGEFNTIKIACENICHQSIFYPQSVYKKNDYDLNFPIYADYIYNLRLWNKVRYKYIPICVSYYNCSGISGKGSDDEKYSKPFFKEVRKNLGFSYYLIKRLYKIFRK